MNDHNRRMVEELTAQIAISAAHVIRDAWVRRRLIDIDENPRQLGEEVVNEAFARGGNRDGEQQPEGLIEQMIQLLATARELLARGRA